MKLPNPYLWRNRKIQESGFLAGWALYTASKILEGIGIAVGYLLLAPLWMREYTNSLPVIGTQSSAWHLLWLLVLFLALCALDTARIHSEGQSQGKSKSNRDSDSRTIAALQVM